MKYPFICNLECGFLVVPKKDAEQLGILEKISRFSHMQGNWLFLEQQRDARIFQEKMIEAGKEFAFTVRHSDKDCAYVKALPQYQPK